MFSFKKKRFGLVRVNLKKNRVRVRVYGLGLGFSIDMNNITRLTTPIGCCVFA